MNAVDACIARLEAAGVAVDGTTLFVGTSSTPPDGAGPFVTLVPYGGGAPIGTHNEGLTAQRQQAVQVVCRAQQSSAALATAVAAYQALVVTNLVIGGTWFRKLTPIHEPFELPVDGQRRSRWAFSVESIYAQ